MRESIKRSKLLRRVIGLLKLQPLTKWALTRFPVGRRLPGGSIYRIKAVESFFVADEIFKSNAYGTLMEEAMIESFVDLGCNTGFLACLLCEKFGRENLKGVLVDGNPEMVKEAEWHLEQNELRNVSAVCGVVGPQDKETSEFYVSYFNISSCAKGFDGNYPTPITGKIKTIYVPVIDVHKLWTRLFGNERINLLKIDIEGSEVEFLDNSEAFLINVDWIVIEWHKWHVSFNEINEKLALMSFDLIEITKENPVCGLALYRNNCISAKQG